MALEVSLNASRVALEPYLAALIRRGTPDALADAASVRAELAARTWQNVNPYAERATA
jgi:hypothetical protein